MHVSICMLHDGMDFVRPHTLNEVSCSTCIREYPDHYIASIASRPVYRSSAVEMRKIGGTHVPEPPRAAASDSERSRAESLRRARAAIRDICACSAFTHFWTLTLSASEVDRYDYKAIIRKVNKWLSNAVTRKGLAYVLIPEYHKDGAIHFHGLARSAQPMGYVDSGHKTRVGQTVYNLASWRYGWTVCIELEGDYARVVNYIRKYINKGSDKVGGRWYLSGGDISRPRKTYEDWDFSEIDAPAHAIEGAAVSFKYIRIDKDNS